MSYTDFEIRTDDIKVSGRHDESESVSVTVTVTNTGDTYAGKEVVQIGSSLARRETGGRSSGVWQALKDKLLAPKESQTTMTITFPCCIS